MVIVSLLPKKKELKKKRKQKQQDTCDKIKGTEPDRERV